MIAVGCDHGGYDLKQLVLKHLEEKGMEYKDCGCYSKEAVDYPIYGKAVANLVASGECDRGIVICTTGIGISIAANKIKGIRAALCTNTLMASLTRRHNDANILALSAGIIGPLVAMEIVETFLSTKFSGEDRHQQRIENIED